MICQSVGQADQDTLHRVKDTCLAYRTERQPDQLSEDIVAAIVPGVSGDTPKNDCLDAAWRSLKALGNKHVGPKIGLVQMNKTELLQQVYTRGTWNRTPDHHLVFTYQVVPRQGGGRKRMKYLTDGAGPGDTAFNVWPVPVTTVSNMPKTSAQVHDEIFANDVAQDSGAEDGSGTAIVQDLGDNLIPFPREFHERLTREMIYVWELDVGIIFNPGSGKSLLAFILENRRAVAIVKNKAHRDFIMNNLSEAVKTQGLAPDARPAKPEELTAWETRKGSTCPPAVPPAPSLCVAAGVGATTRPPASAGMPSPPAARRGPTLLGLPVPPAGGPPPPQPATGGLAGFGAAVLQ